MGRRGAERSRASRARCHLVAGQSSARCGGTSTAASCEPLSAAEIYDVTTGTWSLTRPLPLAVARGPAAVRLLDDRVLVTGGGTPCGDVSRSAVIFDPASNAWSSASPMNVARQFHTAVLMRDGRVLVTGGAVTQDGNVADAEAYDPPTGGWTVVPRRVPQGTACDGFVQSFAALLDPMESVVSRGTDSSCSSTAIVPHTRFLVTGGTLGSGKRLESAEVFEPLRESRTPTGPLLSARAGHTATRLINGSVLIAGGNDGTGSIVAVEIWIPQVPYASAPIGVVRGGVDRQRGTVNFGGLLAAVVDSKRHLLISYTRGRPTTRILEWELIENRVRFPYVREIGKGFEEFHSIRIDREDNIWAVAPSANEVFKFSPTGELLLRFGAPPPPDTEAATAAASLPRLARTYLDRPLDIAWDGAGNVFVVDGERNPRIAKFDRRGRFVTAAGGRGTRPGQMISPHSLAIDANGNVYVADGGNARIQVFSNALAPLAVYDTIGSPWALCMTSGKHQYLFSASNPDRTDITKGDLTGEVYKLELDGTIVGRFGGSYNSRGGFRVPHFLDCVSETELIEVVISDDSRERASASALSSGRQLFTVGFSIGSNDVDLRPSLLASTTARGSITSGTTRCIERSVSRTASTADR
jgi:NHL repeat/Galactose oxidase, central domain/Kelch motif